jgi:hypothetical protein
MTIALPAPHRYIPVSQMLVVRPARPENIMRAEIERLVEEIKQSVGLLRRHL